MIYGNTFCSIAYFPRCKQTFFWSTIGYNKDNLKPLQDIIGLAMVQYQLMWQRPLYPQNHMVWESVKERYVSVAPRWIYVASKVLLHFYSKRNKFFFTVLNLSRGYTFCKNIWLPPTAILRSRVILIFGPQVQS